MQEAIEIMNRPDKGFMVSFNLMEAIGLRGDYFPDKHAREELIPTEKEAWDLAEIFASHTVGEAYDVYVIDSNFKPIEEGEFRNRRIYNRYR